MSNTIEQIFAELTITNLRRNLADSGFRLVSVDYTIEYVVCIQRRADGYTYYGNGPDITYAADVAIKFASLSSE